MRRRLIFTAAAAGLTGTFIPENAFADAIHNAVRPDVDTWDTRLAALGEDNMRLGSALMRPAIETALGEIMSTPHTGKLATHTAQLLMLFARTEDDPLSAVTQYEAATEAATDTGDATTMAWVYGRAALAAGGEETTAHLTPGYAERAIAIGRSNNQLSAIGVYLAHAALARNWANLGNVDHALSACEDAQRAYDHVDPDADGSEYTYADWRHALTMSYPLSLIGHSSAETWATEAYQMGATGRFTTHLQLHEAIRRHREGDPSSADAARAAMEAATGDQTTLILRTMATQAGAHEYAPTT